MSEFWRFQLELLLRLVLACVCGILIGYERQNRLKVAGVRTHLIVALSSALMMIVSKYGFQDLLGMKGIGLDPSRIAAQIVSGVGFLGVGIIFVRKKEISGLTTAAGIWATAGVGMALGSGMYLVGVTVAVLIIIVQIVLHKDLRWFHPYAQRVVFELENAEETLRSVQDEISKRNIEILSVKIKREQGNHMTADFQLRINGGKKVSDLVAVFNENEHVLSIEV